MIQEERKHKEKKKNNKHAAIKHATYMSSIKKTWKRAYIWPNISAFHAESNTKSKNIASTASKYTSKRQMMEWSG